MTTPTLFRPAAWPEPRTEHLVDATGATWRVLRTITLELWRVPLVTGRALSRVPAECWPPILVTALAGVLGVAALVGFLADPRSLGEVGWSILSGLVIFGVICVVIAVAYATREQTILGRGHAKFTARRTLTGRVEMKSYYKKPRKGHAHFVAPPTRTAKPQCKPIVAVHEGGHAAAAEAVGGKALEAKVTSGGGWTRWRAPRHLDRFDTVVAYTAFMAGGEVAAHSTQGCGADHAMMDDYLKRLPWSERGRAKSQGYSKAHTAQWTHGRMRDKVATALYTKGHWSR